MGAFRVGGAGTLCLGALVLFALGIFGFVEARQDAHAAGHETSTTADVTRRYDSGVVSANGNTNPKYLCSYDFTVDGQFYHGSGCPDSGFDDSIKGQLLDQVGRIQRIKATVYYDSTDPSVNSLQRLGPSSDRYSRGGVFFICLGVLALGAGIAMAMIGNNGDTAAGAMADGSEGGSDASGGISASDQAMLDHLSKVHWSADSSEPSQRD